MGRRNRPAAHSSRGGRCCSCRPVAGLFMAPHGNNVAPGSAEHSWELGFRGGSSIRAPGVTGTTVVQLTNLTIILTATRIDQTASELEETTPPVVQRQLLGRSRSESPILLLDHALIPATRTLQVVHFTSRSGSAVVHFLAGWGATAPSVPSFKKGCPFLQIG